jgi:cytoskeletal protein CcmA (bactofilin family)
MMGGSAVTTEARLNLVINGTGRSSGGVFRNVTINGTGRVTGDIDCVMFECHGTNKVMGQMTAKRMSVHGTSKVHGRIQAEDVHIHGTLSAGGGVECKDLSVGGVLSIHGPLKAEIADVQGMLTVRDDCQAESLRVQGALTVDGLLNAGTLELGLYGPATAQEIGGGRIRVRRIKRFGFARWFRPFTANRLTAEVIEGDEIDLEFTKAQVVRGNVVRIGRGCEIDLVEYKQDLHKAAEARVRQERQV